MWHFILTPVVPAEFCLELPPVEAPPNCDVTLYSDSCCSSRVLSGASTCWSATQLWCHTLFWLLLFQQSFAWSFHLLKRHPTMTSHFILTPAIPAEFCPGFHLSKHHGHPSMTSHSTLILLFQRSFVWAFTYRSTTATQAWHHTLLWFCCSSGVLSGLPPVEAPPGHDVAAPAGEHLCLQRLQQAQRSVKLLPGIRFPFLFMP